MSRRNPSICIGTLNDEQVFLTPEDRRTHLHIIGPSNSGKTRMMEHMIKQDILAGDGICVLDPTGGLFERLAKWCTARGLQRRRPLHFFDVNSDDWVPSFNPLMVRDDEDIAKRADAMVLACSRVWSEDASSTPLLKRVLRVVFTALIENKLTLVEGIELVMPPLSEIDQNVREYLTGFLQNPYAKRVWAEFNQMKADRLNDTFSSTNNRLADFLMSERMTCMFGSTEGVLDLSKSMNQGDMIIVNLQPLKISHDNSKLIGTLITNELLQVARSRDNDEAAKKPFYCYLDEAYRFLTDDIEQALDETRQKGLHYILAHQRLGQLSQAGSNIYSAVMSIRNKIVFGDLESEETGILARELYQSEYDEDAEIEEMRRPVVVEYKIRKNRQHRKTKTRGRNMGTANMDTRMKSETRSNALSLPTDAFGHATTGEFMDGGGSGKSTGKANTRGKTFGSNQSDGLTDGWAESAWPVLEERAGSLRSFEDQMHIHARQLRTLPNREVILKLRQKPPKQIAVPYVGNPVTRSQRLPGFFSSAAQQSGFIHSAEDVQQQYVRRRSLLNRNAQSVLTDSFPDDPNDFFE